jgi:hypothetical protein
MVAGGGDRRAADGAEAGAGRDGGVRQAAAHMADEGVGGLEQLVREARRARRSCPSG